MRKIKFVECAKPVCILGKMKPHVMFPFSHVMMVMLAESQMFFPLPRPSIGKPSLPSLIIHKQKFPFILAAIMVTGHVLEMY